MRYERVEWCSCCSFMAVNGVQSRHPQHAPFSASALAWSGVCRPIWPSDHTVAALMWSSFSLMRESFSAPTPAWRACVMGNACFHVRRGGGEMSACMKERHVKICRGHLGS